ncbi:MAG: SlyX family protein [Desulfovibrio sp.]|nr:SlyX family protein [Desulfovibrio sp.]
MADLDTRIARLEEQQYFQETLLQELDVALRAQQKSIDALEKQVQVMQTELSVLRELLGPKGENVPPPHYLPEQFQNQV